MDENSVTVTNNTGNAINVEISTDTSLLNIESAALYTTAIVEHNAKTDAHLNIVSPIKDDIQEINQSLEGLNSSLQAKANSSDVTASLLTKANQSTTYTKTEVDTAMANKVNTSDLTLTKQGNTFNGNSKLIQTTSTGKYPALDGSLITNLPTYIPKGYSHIYYDNPGSPGYLTITIATAGTYVGVSNSAIQINQISSDFTCSNGIITCAVAGKYKLNADACLSSGAASQAIGLAIFKNGARLSTIAFNECYISYSVAINGILDLSVGSTVQLAVTNYSSTNQVRIYNLNLVLQRIE